MFIADLASRALFWLADANCGVWAATDQLARGILCARSTGIYVFPLANVVAFAALIVFAYRARFDSAAHNG